MVSDGIFGVDKLLKNEPSEKPIKVNLSHYHKFVANSRGQND